MLGRSRHLDAVWQEEGAAKRHFHYLKPATARVVSRPEDVRPTTNRLASLHPRRPSVVRREQRRDLGIDGNQVEHRHAEHGRQIRGVVSQEPTARKDWPNSVAWPEEHVLIQELNEVAKVPAVGRRDIRLDERTLVLQHDRVAVDGDCHGLRSSYSEQLQARGGPEQSGSGLEPPRATQAREVLACRYVIEERAQFRVFGNGERQWLRNL